MAPSPETIQITQRVASDEEDFWRIRRFLSATYPLTPLGFNWEVRRWDGSRFHREESTWPGPRERNRVAMWESAPGALVGVVNAEALGDAYLQLHPAFRHLEDAMIQWAVDHLSVPTQHGFTQFEMFAFDYDTQRQEKLATHGFEKTARGGVSRRMRLAERPPADTPPIAPYRLGTTEPDELANCQRVADLLNAAFRRTGHTAQEFQTFTRHAPSYRPALDLVAQAPDGSFAAYVGIAYDPETRHATFEPVCTHPEHQRRGLAKALMLDGIRRLHELGAHDVTVETGDMLPANRLYASLGFTEVARGAVWVRVRP